MSQPYLKDSVTGIATWQEGINGAACVTDPNTINLIDNAGTYTYFGTAPEGSLFSAAVWQVRRMTNATGSTFPTAGGVLTSWNNRATTTYNTGV